MRTAATIPQRHVVGIAAVLGSIILAVAVSPVWLLATVALTAITLIRYVVLIWRSGHSEPAMIPLALVNLIVLTGAIACALSSR
ncbi:hypothetical protein [Rathayibacter toxicus]|uniref:Uncharacterized protein n=1 Tax=Rathayibacter toxicus TaxID=145458 RepID=A0A2S5Y4R7_9MICO|nr:hypothetical protein [Rathayibacter toxicus]PPH22202.1 hypothetical protein C5D17_08435 [Rathayibacter toxicus]PPH56572.1 hypothetical protein C5D30_08425 [Rathayibacter toxicus]PPH59621.1 hypothetical protein C5C93_08475 [Rathayibacter toxicus]PPH86424.1 hypothetical protein C5D31_08455 [Rathayibacter toxicus]PPI13733.1 hypothetical protein C5C51_08400 [Rathayibacter toxicus]